MTANVNTQEKVKIEDLQILAKPLAEAWADGRVEHYALAVCVDGESHAWVSCCEAGEQHLVSSHLVFDPDVKTGAVDVG